MNTKVHFVLRRLIFLSWAFSLVIQQHTYFSNASSNKVLKIPVSTRQTADHREKGWETTADHREEGWETTADHREKGWETTADHREKGWEMTKI